jgi:hypothetical protein
MVGLFPMLASIVDWAFQVHIMNIPSPRDPTTWITILSLMAHEMRLISPGVTIEE